MDHRGSCPRPWAIQRELVSQAVSAGAKLSSEAEPARRPDAVSASIREVAAVAAVLKAQGLLRPVTRRTGPMPKAGRTLPAWKS